MTAMKYYVSNDGRYLGGWDTNPPPGAIEVPSAPADARQLWLGDSWGEVPSAPITSLDIDIERDRRIDAGVEFQSVLFQSRATDRENIAGAAQLGFMAVVAGAQAGDLRWSSPDQDFAWIASDNSLVPMDAQTVVAFGKAAAERKQALIFAARQLKDMEPTPADYTDDKWWP